MHLRAGNILGLVIVFSRLKLCRYDLKACILPVHGVSHAFLYCSGGGIDDGALHGTGYIIRNPSWFRTWGCNYDSRLTSKRSAGASIDEGHVSVGQGCVAVDGRRECCDGARGEGVAFGLLCGIS